MFEWNPKAFRREVRVRKLTHLAVADAVGVTREAVTQWMADRKPSIDNLKRLQELGFPVWRLFNTPPPMTEDELAIVDLWGRIPPHNREAFLAMARSLAGEERRKEDRLPDDLEDRRRFKRSGR